MIRFGLGVWSRVWFCFSSLNDMDWLERPLMYKQNIASVTRDGPTMLQAHARGSWRVRLLPCIFLIRHFRGPSMHFIKCLLRLKCNQLIINGLIYLGSFMIPSKCRNGFSFLAGKTHYNFRISIVKCVSIVFNIYNHDIFRTTT